MLVERIWLRVDHVTTKAVQQEQDPFRQNGTETISGALVSHKGIYLRLYWHHKEY